MLEIKLLELNEIETIKEVFEEESDKVLDCKKVGDFLKTPNCYAFILKKDENTIGFAYGYGLTRPDGKVMFYLHDIGILTKHRDKGYGTEFMKWIVDFVKTKGFSEIFLVTDYNNPRACRVYEKTGFENHIPDEVCYVNEFNKKKN